MGGLLGAERDSGPTKSFLRLDYVGPPSRAKRICIYCRVSSDEQSETQNIKAQINLLKRVAEAQSGDDVSECDRVNLVEVIGADDGISGTLKLEERPGGQRLIQLVLDGQVDEVWIYALDRLARSLGLLIEIERFLTAHGVAVVSQRDAVNTKTHTGKLVFHVLGAIAEWESDNITERMILGRNEKAAQGRWTGGPVPLGYDVNSEGIVSKSDRFVEQLGITEVEMVKAIFQRVADGESSLRVAKWLNQHNVPSAKRYQKGKTTKGSAPKVLYLRDSWARERISAMIRNSIYRGEHVVKTRMGPVVRPAPALVSALLWRQANARMTSNRSISRRPDHRVYLFAGLIKDDRGHAMVGHHVRDLDVERRTGRAHYRHYYHCARKNNGFLTRGEMPCISRSFPAEAIERAIWKHVCEIVCDPDSHIEAALARRRHVIDQVQNAAPRLRDLRVHESEITKRRQATFNLMAAGRLSDEEADNQLGQLSETLAQARVDISALEARIASADASVENIDTAVRAIRALRECVEEADRTNDREKKLHVVRALVSKVTAVTEVRDGKKHGRIEAIIRPNVAVTFDYVGRSLA